MTVFLLNETLREIVDALDGDFRKFLIELHQLPKLHLFAHIHQLLNMDTVQRFKEAILEFGLAVGFALQQTSFFRPDLDYFLEHYTPNALVLKVYPKGYQYA